VIRVRRVSLEDPTGKASPVHAPSPWRHALVTATPRKRYTTQTLRSGASGCRARRTGIGWISVRRSGSPLPPPTFGAGRGGVETHRRGGRTAIPGGGGGVPFPQRGSGPQPCHPRVAHRITDRSHAWDQAVEAPPPPEGEGGVSGRDLPKRNRRCPHPVGTQKQTKKPGPSH